MRRTPRLRALVHSATRPYRALSRALADAGAAIADGDARFWDLSTDGADRSGRPPLTTRPLRSEATR